MRPQHDEAPPLGAAAGLPEAVESWRADTPECAEESTLRELAAALRERGYEVRRVDGALVVMRWHLLTIVGTVDELRTFARRAGCAS